jgi:hypothetical protein
LKINPSLKEALGPLIQAFVLFVLLYKMKVTGPALYIETLMFQVLPSIIVMPDMEYEARFNELEIANICFPICFVLFLDEASGVLTAEYFASEV